jgi:hypothetical protein
MSGLTPPTYAYGRSDVPGVVAANVFISFFNPANSGKIMLAIQGIVTAYSIGLSETAVSMHARFVSSASGGTLVDPDLIYPLRSDWPSPSLVVRTGNPTVSLTPDYGTLANFPPPISDKIGAVAGGVATTPSAGGVPYLPGEGFCYRTSAGNTNQRWNIQFIWVEVDV